MKGFAIALLCLLVAVSSFAGNISASTSSVMTGSWQLFGLATDTVASVYETPTGTVLAGTFTKGIYRSTDHGTTWSVTTGTAGYRINDMAYISGALWAGLELGGLYKSTDDGATWVRQTLPSPIPVTASVRKLATNLNGDFLASVYDVPSDEGYGIGRSTDGGASWGPTSGLLEGNVTDIVTSPTTGHMFSAVKGSNGLYKSTDNGVTWSLTSMTQSYRVYSLGVSPNGTVFASTGVDAPNAPVADGIYRSTDDGATWSSVNNGITSPSTFKASGTVVFGVDGSVFAGSLSNGVVHSTDNGNSWSAFNVGLPIPLVAALGTGKNGVVYTCGLGVYSTTVTTGVTEHSPAAPISFTLEQNYPNPFNPKTGVRFQVLGVSDVKIAVYDLLGKEVAVLVDERKEPGAYQVQFDGSRLASGVYIYRMTAGSFVQSRQMLLVK